MKRKTKQKKSQHSTANISQDSQCETRSRKLSPTNRTDDTPTALSVSTTQAPRVLSSTKLNCVRSESLTDRRTRSSGEEKLSDLSVRDAIQPISEWSASQSDFGQEREGTTVSKPEVTTSEKAGTEKSDTMQSLNHRRINKRELKALLKQTKKSHVVLDEQLVATLDELANRLKTCAIDLIPFVAKPAKVAPSPEEIVATEMRRPMRGRPGSRRGRRGRGCRRILCSTRISQPPLHPIPASWVPLMLPFCHPTRPDSSLGSPWLNHLSETRVNRFINNMQSILREQTTTTGVALPVKPDVKPVMDNSISPGELSGFRTSQAPSEMHTHQLVQNPILTGSEIRDPIPVSNETTLSRPPCVPPRGRPRGRRPSRWRGGSRLLTRPLVSSHNLGDQTGAQPLKLSKPKSKPRISRELRGLVTWDAVIAQQKRLDEAQSDKNAFTDQRRIDPTLAVAEDLLAQAAASDDVPQRIRRTRQSSGNPHVHGPLSETTSVTTATSEITDSEVAFHSKSGDAFSTTRSALSTDTSSMTSDLTAHPGRNPDRREQRASALASVTTEKDATNALLPVDDTMSCSVKYSPISVDHEPELATQDQVKAEVPSPPQLRNPLKAGKKKRLGHLQQPISSELNASDIPSSLSPALSLSNDSSQVVDGPHSTIKRRRQTQADSNSPSAPAADQPYSSEDTTEVHSSDPSVGSRRTAASRDSFLPPRKRYKVGLEVDSATVVATADPTAPTEDTLNESEKRECHVDLVKMAPVKSHKRGRPPRRPPSSSDSQICMSATPIEAGQTESSTLNSDRPKREAAVIGFASLVSTNLNNNIPFHLDSPSGQRSSEPDVSSLPESTGSGPTTPQPLTPRRRGRPPKVHHVAPTPTETEMSGAQTTSDKHSSTGRRTRPAVVLSPGGKTYKPASSTTETPSPFIATNDSSSALSTIKRIGETNGVSQNESSKEQASTQPIRKVGRPRLRPKSPVKELDRKSPVLPAMSKTIIQPLPEHNSLFKGHLICESIRPNVDHESLQKGPVSEVFLRFLNEPDVKETTSRLASPFLHLPPPEKYPEFYRFVISSYSGTIIRAHFADSLIRRIFPGTSESAHLIDEPLFGLEFPCLCLASVMQWLSSNNADRLGQELGLSASEQALTAIDPNDAQTGLPLLDAAVESVLSVWEAFAGRRSWLGRRLMRLRALYSTIRNQCALLIAEQYNQIAPPLKATAVLNMPSCKFPLTGAKKKSDRRALERGAEVIRCLCGFRVEGGHIMVQCDHCASWQHLPCLWWALNQAMLDKSRAPDSINLCRAVLYAAQAVGSSDIFGADTGGKPDSNDSPYFCPVCLDLNGLTLEYPRSLSAAMAMDDLDSVFSLQETTVEGEHEFWSLASADDTHQIRTDDYAFIHRAWLKLALSESASGRIDYKATLPTRLPDLSAMTPYDHVIFRIYRLWKDTSGHSWMEGGLFLRPYDLPSPMGGTVDTTDTPQRLWHFREVIYDETSRLVLPLSAWLGRCVVLCPSAFRTGRPADLVSYKGALQFLAGSDTLTTTTSSDADSLDDDRLVFVCDKLFERILPASGSSFGCRFDEISPGYLKVNMRPYCFLRKPDMSSSNRALLSRNFTAHQLLEHDQCSATDSSTVANLLPKPTGTPATPAVPAQSKGQKLARVVDWLERKRQLGVTSTPVESAAISAKPEDVTSSPTPLPRPSRGRPRGSRNRGRPPASFKLVKESDTSTSEEVIIPEDSSRVSVAPLTTSEPMTSSVAQSPTKSAELDASEQNPTIFSDVSSPSVETPTKPSNIISNGEDTLLPSASPEPPLSTIEADLRERQPSIEGLAIIRKTSYSIRTVSAPSSPKSFANRDRERHLRRTRFASASESVDSHSTRPLELMEQPVSSAIKSPPLAEPLVTTSATSLDKPTAVETSPVDHVTQDSIENSTTAEMNNVLSPVASRNASPINEDHFDSSNVDLADKTVCLDPSFHEVPIEPSGSVSVVQRNPSFSCQVCHIEPELQLSEGLSPIPAAEQIQPQSVPDTSSLLPDAVEDMQKTSDSIILEQPSLESVDSRHGVQSTPDPTNNGLVEEDNATECSVDSSPKPDHGETSTPMGDDHSGAIAAQSRTAELRSAFTVENLAQMRSTSGDNGDQNSEAPDTVDERPKADTGIPLSPTVSASEDTIADAHGDAGATPVLDEPGTSGESANLPRLPSEIIQCLSGQLEGVPYHEELPTTSSDRPRLSNPPVRDRSDSRSSPERRSTPLSGQRRRDDARSSSHRDQHRRESNTFHRADDHHRNYRHRTERSPPTRREDDWYERQSYRHDRDFYWRRRDRSSSGNHHNNNNPRRDYFDSSYRFYDRTQR